MTRTHNPQPTVHYSQVEDILQLLDIDKKQLAYETGVAPATISGWKTEGRCPKYFAVACEGLRRRYNCKLKTPHTFLVRVLPERLQALTSYLEILPSCRFKEIFPTEEN